MFQFKYIVFCSVVLYLTVFCNRFISKRFVPNTRWLFKTCTYYVVCCTYYVVSWFHCVDTLYIKFRFSETLWVINFMTRISFIETRYKFRTLSVDLPQKWIKGLPRKLFSPSSKNKKPKSFLYFSKKQFFLYFGKWNFLAPSLKSLLYFSEKKSTFNFLHESFLHQNFFHQNLLHKNHQKKVLCRH